MQKRLTITVDEKVHAGLHSRIGAGRISRFIEDLVRPHVLDEELERAYAEMVLDEEREGEALDWSEATAGDVSDEPR